VRYVFTPAAQQELIDAVGWYLGEGGTVTAERFESPVYRSVRLLARMPRLGPSVYRRFRLWSVKDFPYTLVYRIEADRISVIALAHQSRAPGHWRKR
jgi:plasmid stabilization system protein ParE